MMRPIVLLLSALVPLSLVSCRVPTAGEQEVVRLLEAQKDIWNRGELVAFVERGYWNSDDLSFMNRDSWERGFDTLLSRFERTYGERHGMGTLDFKDLETTVLGEWYIMVRGRWSLWYEDRERHQGLFTLIFRYTGDGWRIVHDHTSSAHPTEIDSDAEPDAGGPDSPANSQDTHEEQ